MMSDTQANRTDERPASIGGQEGRGRASEETRSPVPWLVLGLLLEQPSHGYEVSQRYEERFGSFASLSVPRVYAALDRLRDSGMIEPVVLDTATPARKQHLMRRSYRVTAAGVGAYRSWVAERMHDDPHRPQLLARIASAGTLGLDGVLAVIDRYENTCVEELRALQTDSEELELGTCSPEEIAAFLITDQQRRELNARREWAIHARGVLQAQLRRRDGAAKDDG
jgi:DNA-binding PadR family transcriptional regulator